MGIRSGDEYKKPDFKMPPGGDWPCPTCANVNFARRTKCNKCQEPKPKTGDPLLVDKVFNVHVYFRMSHTWVALRECTRKEIGLAFLVAT
jgi:hypothetical protein